MTSQLFAEKMLEWQFDVTSAWQNSTTTSSLFHAIEDKTNNKFCIVQLPSIC
jgi:hypothetical protein